MKKFRVYILILVTGLLLLWNTPAKAELSKETDKQTDELEARISELEEYVASISAKLKKFQKSVKPELKEKIDEEDAS